MQKGIIVDEANIIRIRLREILEKEFVIVAEASMGEEVLQMY
jgi:two-component system chemotaxis response regulator CheY